jgi:hypothetical protein
LMVLGSAVIGQEKAGGVGVPVPSPTVLDTGESPIGVLRTVDGLGFKDAFFNRSGRPISAYVVVTDFNGGKRLMMEHYGGRHAIGGGSTPFRIETYQGMAMPLRSFDWVLFADGTAWGADVHGRSVELLNFRRGAEAAFAKAIELGLLQTPNWGVRAWEINVKDLAARVMTERQYFDSGFDSTIAMLAYDRRLQTDEAFRIAFEQLKASRDTLFGK